MPGRLFSPALCGLPFRITPAEPNIAQHALVEPKQTTALIPTLESCGQPEAQSALR
ncbi:protein of unknown function [Candidatus Filomicrobium marinum]|uniref:Uncharacterized protein n=1 Tax=Candidatus Filomicrobium marinum TaxID=1608628 RepID=A0A0D6JH88_9HYPH|nr:protein of unknown function [Candidatus Filomicrobium marinum]CPR20027.1 protein of unknown function [Candidatus Filomicrobium marinum]